MGTNSDSKEAAKLWALLDSAVDAIVTIEKDGTIDTINPATERLFQYREDELVGRNIKMLMPEPYQAEHDSYLRRYCETGKRNIIGIGREVSGRRKDGSTFPMHLSVSEFRADGARLFTGIIRDLSDQKRAESALHQAQKMEAVGQLTGGVAHDFNNLLTVITGNLELLDLRLEDETDLELLTEAREAAELGARLTSRLLAFARRSHLEPRVIDLNALVLGLTEMLHRTLGETIDLSTSLSVGLWQTQVDETQVESAILNLVVNARDAMPQGGKLILETFNDSIGRAAATTAGLEPGEYVRLSVSDTGHGMPEEVRQRAFEPFFTTKDAKHGTGLGLSMVFGFARQSGGHITIESEVGSGTTINLFLPRNTGGAGRMAAGKVATEPTAGELILVVEDDARVRRLTCRRLTELGYRVLDASQSEAALSLLGQKPDIELVFTDLVMPGGISGYDLAMQIREKYPNVGVLLTSGYSEELIERETLSTSEIGLLRKPYRNAELAAAIRKALAG
ncbi:MAG: PAS domain S-box protein [Methyloligella sp. ZOD6]